MIYLNNCIDGAQKYIKNDSVDLGIADPPYNLKFGGTTQTKTKRPRFQVIENDDLSPAAYRRFSLSWIREAYRVLKPGRHLYVCIDWRTYPDMVRWLKLVGFTIKNCIVWDKKQMGMGWQYRYRHEFIILAVKGKNKARRISTRKKSDIWEISRIPGNLTIHPTEKPLELLKTMIEFSSEPGEYVVDFFSGSGVASAACEELGRKWDAFEVDPHWHEISLKRIHDLIQN